MDTVFTDFTPVDVASRKQVGVKPGDTVRVHQRIEEKGKTRIQIFEGLVLAVKHGTEPGATFTVRRVASGVGVERIFPLYSPMIEKIEIVKRAKVRRAKLYYIRDKVAREIRRQMRRARLVEISTEDFKKEEEESSAEASEESQAEAPSEEAVEQDTPAEEKKEDAAPAKGKVEEVPEKAEKKA